MSEIKACLECKTPIKGRNDKKFCDDLCRNAYNNKLNSDVNKLVRNVNNTLRKNRRILADLNPRGKSKATKEKLLFHGFDFNYYTNTYTTKAGATYYFCYEQGYLPLDGDYFALVVRQEYVNEK